jgi:hypothetical protein
MNAASATSPIKAQYSETEAAASLGMTVEELRALIRDNITGDEADLSGLPVTAFQPSDVLVLRILADRLVMATTPY